MLNAYERACDAVTSFDLRVVDTNHSMLTRTVDPVKETAGEWRPVSEAERDKLRHVQVTRQHYQGGRFRVEPQETNGRRHLDNTQTTVWDGAVEKFLNAPARFGRLAPRARTLPSSYGINYLNLFKALDGDLTYAALVRTRSPASVTVARQGRTVVVTAQPEPNSPARGSDWGVTLALDPDRGFMPVRIDLFDRQGGVSVVQSRYENELTEVEPGLWVPCRSRVPVFLRDRNSQFDGRELGFHVVEFDPERSRFNCDLEDSLFVLEFPPGTEVQDEIRDTAYRVGAKTKQNYLDFLALQGRLSVEELRRTNPGLRVRTAVAPSLGKRLLLWINGGFLVALGAAWAYRSWRRRSATPPPARA